MENREPSIFDGADRMYCTAPNRITVLGPTTRHEQIAKVLRDFRKVYPRNISICCKGEEASAWGMSLDESERILVFLRKRPQKILFYDVSADCATILIGSISGTRWAELHSKLPRWYKSGQIKITVSDLDAED